MVTLAEFQQGPAAVIDLRGLARVLGRRKAWIAGATGLCALVALVVALSMTPRYVSQIKLLIDPRGLQILPNDLNGGAASTDATFAVLESQVQVITSTEVLQKVIAKLKLQDDPEFAAAGTPPATDGAEAPPSMDGRTWAALRTLRKRLDVRRPDRTFILDLSVWTASAEKSRQIVDAVAQSYLDVQAQMQAETATRTATALEARLGALRQNVAAAEQQAESYRTANNLVGAEGRLLSDQELADLTNQLSAQRIRTAELQARLDVLRKRTEGAPLDTFAEALQSSTITDLRARYAEAKKAEADSVVSLGPRHPAVIAAQAQVQQIRELIDAELGRVQRSLETEYQRAKAVETELTRQIAVARRVSASDRPPVLKLKELENEVAARRAVYETVQRRAKEIREEGMLDRTNARIISPATLPLPEYVVSRALVLAGGVAFGLLLGVFLAAFRNQFDGTAWDVDQLFERTGLFNLGSAARKDVAAASLAADPEALKRLEGLRPLPEMLTMALGKSPGAVLVVSAGSAAASAAMTVVLAKLAGEAGLRALAVDGTSRVKTITRQFGLGDKAGFAEARLGLLPLSLFEVTTPVGLKVLPAGGAAKGPRAAEALPKVQDGFAPYDMTVIDGGSLGDRDYLASLGLAGIVIIVVEAGKSRCDLIVRSLSTLNPHHARLVATVFQA
ncbi:GumC family protein [Bradyrhizobium sp. 2TAF24]|uniref:GumC family protein n=1 Tax=Bradyrhizobium sp. 2TAF24 TaxID=3233011 RepID=UPI003F90F25E